MIRYLITTFIITIYSLSLFAQAPRIETLKIFKNKKDVEVTSIYQDDKGYMWIGTDAGLVKYDGVDFIEINDDMRITQSEVSCMITDSTGQLWIGHKNGLITQSNGKELWLFDPEEGLGTREISSFYIDNTGVLWFTTLGEGAYYYSGKHRKRLYSLDMDDGLLDNYVYQLGQDEKGIFYLGTDKGISVYDSEIKQFIGKISMTNGLPDNIVKQLLVRGKSLWIGMEDAGISVYDLTTKQFDNGDEWEFGSINNFEVVSDNEVWVSTKRKGVIKCQIDNSHVSYSSYRKENGLADTRTKIIFADRESNLWIGTKKGLSIRRNNYIEFLGKTEGFDVNQIFSITTDAKGNYWVASEEGLFLVTKNVKGQVNTKRLFENDDFQFATFISVYTDEYGFVWAGTYGMGAYRINSETLDYTKFSLSNGLPNDNVIHITGNEKEIWFSTLGGGIGIMNINDNSFQKLTMQEGMPSDYIYQCYLQNDKTAWVATDGGGVVKISDKEIVPLKHPLMDSIGKVVYSIAGNKEGVVWFNLADHGLIRYENNECQHLTELNNVIYNSIQGLVVRNSSELVLASNLGIGLLNCSSLEMRNIGDEDGLAFLQPNLNAIYKDQANSIYIGTANGIVKLLLPSISEDILPELYITRIKLFDVEIDQNESVFKYNDNYLTFDYSGLWYSTSQSLLYRFMLEGYDLNWRDETTSRSFTYSNLPAGDFTFKVEVKLPNGEWYYGNDAHYTFTVKPPFWKTTVFIIGVIILGFLSIYLFITWRIRKLEYDKQMLEEEVQRRTAEIRKQKDEIEAQRDEIEAQRNYVTEQRDQIEHQNKDITSSIHYALRIQNAVLPPRENFEELFNNYFLFFRPRDIVSGDFYYLNHTHNKIIIAAADSTGHGVPGAFMSILGISLLNQIMVQLEPDFNASTILTELRFQVKKSLRQTGQRDEAKDGMDISLCVIDKGKQVVHFSGAFNPLFMVRNNEPIEYKGDKMPIGVHIVESDHFTNHEIKIQKDDMLFMYSDGFQDQFGGPKQRKFLPKNLRQLLLDNANETPEVQEQKLDEAFLDWKGDSNQVDDIIVIGIKV